MVIYEGKRPDERIKGRPLIPPRLFCPAGSRDICQLQVIASLKTGSKETKCLDGSTMQQLVFRSPNTNNSVCSYPIKWGQDIEIEIEATVDQIKDGTKSRIIQVQLMVTVGQTHTVVDVARIPVEIRDSKSMATCRSINDPHITTFDKR